MLNRLRADGPAVIALDVIFEGATDPNGDRALLEAIRATPDCLVLAYKNFAVGAEPAGSRSGSRPGCSDAPGGRGDGGADRLCRDAAGRGRPQPSRRLQVVIDTTKGLSGEIVTAGTFAFAAADVARRGELRRQPAQLPKASRRVGGTRARARRGSTSEVRPGTVRRVSALDVLDGRVAPERSGTSSW